ncbi:MAG: hypothetical protein ACRC7D_22375 [Aeromonas popoffii]|uniref:hypothetical protein n=1 Tax=Aeromonas popoffii TaxID=70856 RepID=UPI003F339218
MSNIAMSNETNLDWLARELHKWPDGYGTGLLCRGCSFFDTGVSRSVHVYAVDGSDYTTIKEKDWLARRAELQNKPSWEGAPEWAINLVQIASGSWVWIDSETPKMLFGSGDKFEYSGNYGLVLGDWRDTLERRPAYAKAIYDDERASPVPAVFNPITSIEDNQELNMSNKQDVKQDNGWFERGGLPPVGTVCEYTLGANAPWYQCEIKYVIRGDGVVMKRIPCGDEQYCGLLHRHPVSFRPIRTERELAIGEMMKVMNVIDFVGTPHHLASEISAIMYDAGFRKDPK